MGSKIPSNVFNLMFHIYREIFPKVNKELMYWRKRAMKIPNHELRKQALSSLTTKRFHCQGGAVFALLAKHRWEEATRFIVAYQTICDYLDNLCDRSTSMDPNDFRLLHQSLLDALNPENSTQNYYRLRSDQQDDNYLGDLVQTCQHILSGLKGYSHIIRFLLNFEKLYEDLQVHKHVVPSERLNRLKKWHNQNQEKHFSLSWYEFSAATGSTLAIFCMVSYALGDGISSDLASKIERSYFPYVQGLHILLDYYIDQEEDENEGDLNFCSFYVCEEQLKRRIMYFIKQAHISIKTLPNYPFHRMISDGMIGLYLSDPKVYSLGNSKEMRRALLAAGGLRSSFFYWNAKVYRLKK